MDAKQWKLFARARIDGGYLSDEEWDDVLNALVSAAESGRGGKFSKVISAICLIDDNQQRKGKEPAE